ncbi:MAG: hypothetical protein L0216_03425, partial [Planctomycetales bacterium]|nr:hypothetical protein [Planctomycetales bacterium]
MSGTRGRVPRTVHARAPCRVDLAGGTLDIHPLPVLLGRVTTVHAAVEVFAEATARRLPGRAVELRAEDLAGDVRAASPEALPRDGPARLLAVAVRTAAPDGGVRLETRSAAPPGSGLGGSSALLVAILGALARLGGREGPPESLLPLADRIEGNVLQTLTGTQDYLPALEGGAAVLTLGLGGTRRERVGPADEALDRGLVLAYTGASHASGDLNWRILRAVLDGDREVRGKIGRLAEVAERAAEALRAGDLAALGRAMDADWEVRRTLA